MGVVEAAKGHGYSRGSCNSRASLGFLALCEDCHPQPWLHFKLFHDGRRALAQLICIDSDAAVIALSSGVSELAALVEGASLAFGTRCLGNDVNGG
eukprot:4583214-Amphidinium_carterae.1